MRRRPTEAPVNLLDEVCILNVVQMCNLEIIQVEAELARREQQQQSFENLGPAALDSLLSRSRGSGDSVPTAPSVTGQRSSQFDQFGSGRQSVRNPSLRRGSVSRGGGRLEVLDNTQPPLQPQDEELSEFESTLNTFRQRNRATG